MEKPKRGAWIAVESPTVDELEQLAEQYQLDLGHLNDAIDPDEVPRTEKEGEQTYIFTRVPVTSGESLSTRTILFIITKQYIFTVSTDHFSLFEKILTTPQSIVTTHRVSFLVSCFFPIIASYNSNVTAINKKLYKMRAGLDEITKKQIVDFIIYEEQLNDILNSVTRTNLILHTLLNGRSLPLTKHDHEFVEDLFLATEQIITGAKNTLQTTRTTRDAHTAIITYNLNEIIKLFTSLTVILTIPTIISSLFGMNVQLPFQEHPAAFIWIGIGTILILAGLFYLFAKKNWL